MFNEIADEYDRHRPAYPDALIDRACDVAGLAPRTNVLEIGCGTGQLTRSLLERGLRVTAIEPGEQCLSPGQREALIAENHVLHRRLGRAIRSSTVACLVTASAL